MSGQVINSGRSRTNRVEKVDKGGKGPAAPRVPPPKRKLVDGAKVPRAHRITPAAASTSAAT